MRELSAAEAVMVMPTELSANRVCEALAWLGISRDVVDVMAGVTFEPREAVFEVHALAEDKPTTVTIVVPITR